MSPLFPSSSLPPHPIYLLPFLIHSILVGTYIYLFISFQHLPGQSDPARSIGVDG
jgi:hypothetical protein